MRIPRRFTSNLKSPYEGITFEKRKSEIREPDGKVVFSQDDILVPGEWSQVATDILAQKYFRRAGVPDPKTGEKRGENDSRQVFHRMAGCWTGWGQSHGYFESEGDARNFYDEVCYMLAHQMAAPNSPQWFNTGLHFAYGIDGPAQGHYYVDPKSGEVRASESAYAHPQPHACFIQGVADDLVGDGGVMDLWVREARLFKYGSGTGTNFSRMRAEGEKLSGGGRSSGLMSFLRVGDRAAGAIKSGGTTRRAAKMVCLDLDHPEIEDFILWKVKEEEKVAALVAGSTIVKRELQCLLESCFVDDIAKTDPLENETLKKALKAAKKAAIPAGMISRALELAKQGIRSIAFTELDVDWQGEAYLTVSGQNSNNSVRVPNRFFEAVEKDENWALRNRTDGKVAREVSAKELWEKISYAAWASADPGVQCDTTINDWHTCPEGGRINASNPCSEYMFLDDTACNLASINLIKFYEEKTGEFRIEDFEHACRLWTVVLEISVLMAQFPSRSIAERSYEYRTLGLGYANLGALLMSMGMPYGSKEALGITGALTSIMTGVSYKTSAEMASELGAFPKYKENRLPMLRVIRNHRRAAYGEANYEGLSVKPQPLTDDGVPEEMVKRARESWDEALEMGEKHGYRNAQVTVIAPTGTIGLVMDCDTTGIEPDFSLVKFKKLAGGGYFRIINQSVPRALERLGYTPTEVREIIGYCSGFGSLEEAPKINHKTLRERGITEEQIRSLEKQLPNAFSLDLAFAQIGSSGSLQELGFTDEEIANANRYVTGTLTIEGAPHLKEEHYAIFDCANPCGTLGKRSLHYTAHIETMAAAQSFISGAISKTINMPVTVTIAEIQDAYLSSWKKGVKAISIYRDGSKLSQPLQASWQDVIAEEEDVDEAPPQTVIKVAEAVARRAMRRELPSRRFGYTVKATVGGQRVYLRTGEYEDGTLGEIFVDMYKEGAAYRSLMNAFAIAVSLGMQYGVPLEEYLNKFHLFRFEPNGHVSDHDNIKFCSSIIDFIFRDLAMNYLGRTDLVHIAPKDRVENARLSVQPSQGMEMGMGAGGGGGGGQASVMSAAGSRDMLLTQEEWSDDHAFQSKMARTQGYEGDPCSDCGQFTLVRGGTCLRCVSCGATSGCS